ncbi:sensor histidine kinase [Flavobacterium psychrophilum]|uniref:sensor histidine kinase n=1 Tax=Flavobacterium psychrophilum TaxID=96345 RepID=UPI0004F934D8|nr:HAMP domain-containing sensor histidine kinase [Flavobacterium psychrophilum]AIN71646.1 histidine kinase [Flavobacterium psychrophilum FPG101]AKC19130.1 histidine kinase [Flavobacterium psychrophilum]AKC23870.1 histidine kinase [Flavobacterium psychrophilum]AKC28498.1 histidine kinase [Flavobacterium psychrophilum]MCB5982407.1 HAMP domain-containing histidine kinase [Flavobacterium psychrophilum]
MKKKINLLILFSVVVLIALSVMQFYLVKTTYDYKVAQFRAEVKTKIADITNDYSDIDSTIFNKKDLLYRELAMRYILDPKTRNRIKNAILQNQFKEELTHKLQLKFEQEIPDLKLDFAIVLNKFVLYNNAKAADTIFAEKPIIGNKLYGDLASLDDAFLVRNYVGTTSGNTLNSDFKLLTEDALYVSVANWETIILRRMAMILGFAILSILTLISLFVFAIKALIKQKKVSDIKTDFINNITHELKTPLATLAISTKILERKEIRDNQQHFDNLVATISRQNNRLQQLIDQVLNNSLEDSEIKLKKEKINSEVFLNVITNDFKISNPSIAISTEFKTVQTSLFLDKFHLTTAIQNVLENAVKYGCNHINIRTSLVNNQFNISIKDDGIGISKNNHSLLFDKFYRVEQGNLHNTKGLGLGLYYVNQIIKAHKGTIMVISDLGKGAIFNISIPF